MFVNIGEIFVKKLNVGLAGVLCGFGVMLSTSAAQALDFNFSYTAGSVTTSGIFTTTLISNELGEYEITGITGTRNGNSISLLALYSFGGNDNLFYPFEPDPFKLTSSGFSYLSAGVPYNVYNAGVNGDYFEGSFGESGGAFSSFAVSQVTGVPFDFNPTEGAALGVPLFIGLGILRKRVARKSAASKAVVAVS